MLIVNLFTIYMNPLLIEYIFIQILYQIPDDNEIKVNTLLMLEKISKQHKKLIRKNRWNKLLISVEDYDKFVYLSQTHNFCNLRLDYIGMFCVEEAEFKNKYKLNFICFHILD